MIVERTQEGKAIARQREDFREGRPPKYGKKQIAHALELLNVYSYKQVEEVTGISKSTLIRAKKKLNIEWVVIRDVYKANEEYYLIDFDWRLDYGKDRKERLQMIIDEICKWLGGIFVIG